MTLKTQPTAMTASLLRQTKRNRHQQRSTSKPLPRINRRMRTSRIKMHMLTVLIQWKPPKWSDQQQEELTRGRRS